MAETHDGCRCTLASGVGVVTSDSRASAALAVVAWTVVARQMQRISEAITMISLVSPALLPLTSRASGAALHAVTVLLSLSKPLHLACRRCERSSGSGAARDAGAGDEGWNRMPARVPWDLGTSFSSPASPSLPPSLTRQPTFRLAIFLCICLQVV